MYCIPYKRYFISYDAESQKYSVISSTSESDFEYSMLALCDTLSDAVKQVDRLMKG